MASNLSKLFFFKSQKRPYNRMKALAEFSLTAPQALDPEQLSDAIKLLEEHNWDALKAARYVNNVQLLDFDDAMKDKGDDPLEAEAPPGPSH